MAATSPTTTRRPTPATSSSARSTSATPTAQRWSSRAGPEPWTRRMSNTPRPWQERPSKPEPDGGGMTVIEGWAVTLECELSPVLDAELTDERLERLLDLLADAGGAVSAVHNRVSATFSHYAPNLHAIGTIVEDATIWFDEKMLEAGF